MSKFLLNLLGQISKDFVYSKIQILFGNNSPQLLAHPAFRPSRGPFFFFFQLANFPFPPQWASASRTEAKHGAAAGRPRAASMVAPMPPPEEKNGRI
jgi:hypothetical protein